MSLFQCDKCGCIENTACCGYWYRSFSKSNPKSLKWCSFCDPDIKAWHFKFSRRFLPKDMFYTNREGNLSHKENHNDARAYILKEEEHDQ